MALFFGTPLVLSASGVVKNAPGHLIGFLCSALAATPTLDLYDNASGASGTHFLQALALTAGTFVPLPAAFVNGCYAVITGTATITFVYS